MNKPDLKNVERNLGRIAPRIFVIVTSVAWHNGASFSFLSKYMTLDYRRIFMIDRHRNGEELREEFRILGSTGNVSA